MEFGTTFGQYEVPYGRMTFSIMNNNNNKFKEFYLQNMAPIEKFHSKVIKFSKFLRNLSIVNIEIILP